jgi:signal transduction histidine kinase
MRREMIRLEQQHAVERERARIARDLHDELGTRLTQISFQGSIAKRSVDDPAETQRRSGPAILLEAKKSLIFVQ